MADSSINWVRPDDCCGSYTWEECFGGIVPDDAVHGGQDCNGEAIFVERVCHRGEVIPCRVCPDHGCAFVGYEGSELRMEHYQVLKSYDIDWQSGQGGEVPPNALGAGRTSQGEILYIGRIEYNGGLFVGKIVPSAGVLSITFEGTELKFPNYEVLVLN